MAGTAYKAHMADTDTAAANGEPPTATTLAQGEPERALLERCQRGDRQAFQQLVQQMMRPAYYHALALVGNHEDALDVSQDAFARAWRSMYRYDPARPFYAWYYVILKRVALNLIRSRQRRREVALEPGSDIQIETAGQGGPDVQHDSDSSRRLVNSVLRQLTLEDREIICMKDMHDLAYKDIAALLDIPIGTVMSRLYAARNRFRQKMQESGYEH